MNKDRYSDINGNLYRGTQSISWHGNVRSSTWVKPRDEHPLFEHWTHISSFCLQPWQSMLILPRTMPISVKRSCTASLSDPTFLSEREYLSLSPPFWLYEQHHFMDQYFTSVRLPWRRCTWGAQLLSLSAASPHSSSILLYHNVLLSSLPYIITVFVVYKVSCCIL